MNEERQAAKALETIAAAHGVATDKAFGAVTPPLYLSSTYAFNGYEQPNRYDYGRAGNPSRDLLSEALAQLEGGAGAVITSSGMAAVDLLFGKLKPKDLVIAPINSSDGYYKLPKARADRGPLSLWFI